MATRTGSSGETVKEDLVITRVFDAPRERVFKAWTDCDRLTRWWGPKGFTSPACRMDARTGGVYLNSMRSPEGRDFWSTGRFREVKEPERIVMTDSFADEKGNIVPASYYGMGEDWPLEMLVSVTLEEDGGKTRLTLKHSGVEKISGKDREDMRQGWCESLDKLAESLKEA